MLDAIVTSLIAAIEAEGIRAVEKYPPEPLDKSSPCVCVSLRSVKLTASGCGDYIGIGTVDGFVKDMYGSKAEFCAALDIYSPTPDLKELINSLYLALYTQSSMTLRGFERKEVVFDTKSGLFLCRCEAKASGCLVCCTSNTRPVYSLGEEDA